MIVGFKIEGGGEKTEGKLREERKSEKHGDRPNPPFPSNIVETYPRPLGAPKSPSNKRKGSLSHSHDFTSFAQKILFIIEIQIL